MMKNKLIVFLCIIFLLLISFVAGSDYLQGDSVEDQHISSKSKNQCDDKKKGEFCTHLPIVTIDTNNQTIPGEARDGSTITTKIKIIDNKKGGNHLSDKADLKTKANIRYRGNSSMNFDKKGYLLKFIHNSGEENPEKVLGMDKHSEWALHGPYLDKTLLRNYLWYHISGKIMDSAPDSRFCELFVDGEYRGVYVMVESPSRGDKGRMQFKKTKKDADDTGYIVRLDKGTDHPLQNLETFSKYTMNTGLDPGLRLDIIYPGKNRLNETLHEYIKRDLNKFEKALYSYDYDSSRYGYSQYIDVDSFVDYYIINEFTQNYDAGNMSTYLYKGNKDKLKMYVWDFNSANDYYINPIDIEDFEFQWNTWYFMLMKDEKFTERIISRYHYLRRHVLNEEYLLSYIDDIVDYLGDAIDRNYEVWGYTFSDSNNLLQPAERNVKSYQEAIEQLKTHIRKRGEFLDQHIDTIKQFSQESKVKKFNH